MTIEPQPIVRWEAKQLTPLDGMDFRSAAL